MAKQLPIATIVNKIGVEGVVTIKETLNKTNQTSQSMRI